MTTLIIIVLFVIFLGGIGSAPVMPYNREREWGWGPSGGLLTLVIVILLILFLTGNLRL